MAENMKHTVITGMDVVLKAREYLRTPFHHQGRLKGVGIDCVGLVIAVLLELGIDLNAALVAQGFEEDEFSRYPRDGTFEHFLKMVSAVSEPDPAFRIGSVMLFKIPHARAPHIGIKTDRGMLHAFDKVGRVAEHRIDELWQRVTHSAWHLREVA